MDYAFFEKLSKQQAVAYLNSFRNEVGKDFLSLYSQLEEAGIPVDYSFNSLEQVFVWAIAQMKTIPRKEDENVPEWIRKTESYQKGLFSFDEPSRILISRVAYYLGECFIKNYQQLSWTTGDTNYMGANMPAVAGFKKKMELSPLVIAENLVSRIVKGGKISDIEAMIKSWQNSL
ncbi:MAG: hypothetical protein QM731_06445 [Chitinophagaceae bacterium]